MATVTLFLALAVTGLVLVDGGRPGGSAGFRADARAGEIAAEFMAATVRKASAKQKVKVAMTPPIVDAGKKPKPASKAKSVFTVAVKPGKNKRPVVLQRQQGKKWKKVATARTNKKGVAQLQGVAVRKGQPVTYRVVAKKFAGLKAATSKKVSTERWLNPSFADEFDGNLLLPHWVHRGQAYSAASKRKCAKGDPRAVSVTNGTLRLSVMKDPLRLTKCQYTSAKGKKGRASYRLNGHVGTEGTYAFRYGYAAARIKFQPERGQHGAFWLQGGNEIDIVEYFGNSHPNPLTSWIYHYPSDTKIGAGGKTRGNIPKPNKYGKNWSKKYHVFSTDWTPKRQIFYINGKEVWRVNKKKFVPKSDQFVVLSLLSSDYYLNYMNENKLPQHMYVDWVRVWEQ